MIPSHRDTGKLLGLQPSSRGAFWPVILEKAYAKIHTSYKALYGGYWHDAVVAILGSNAHRWLHQKYTQEKIWSGLKWATEFGEPMAASSGQKCVKYGLTPRHV